MEIKSVDKYSEPKYPDKQKLQEDPSLLKTMPESWKGNIYVGTALSTLLMFTLTGCMPKNVNGTSSVKEKSSVAPIFEHGTGRGSFGCSSVAPPTFISEEEAFQVMQEEAKLYGLNFKKDGLEIKEVDIPETKYTLNNNDISMTLKASPGNLLLDGYDSDKKIGFEFISEQDYDSWKDKAEGRGGTIESYDYLTTAQVLRTGLNRKNLDSTIGIFFNPISNMKPDEKVDIKDIQPYTVAFAKEDLRKQVKDFLQWLKAQGII